MYYFMINLKLAMFSLTNTYKKNKRSFKKLGQEWLSKGAWNIAFVTLT